MTPEGAPVPVQELIEALVARGLTVAVAESLTGGLLVARLIDVPGASRVVRGGVVAYQTELKARLLGVDAGLLAASGAIHPEVARQMASGVRERLGADIGVSTTGVAGPAPQDGRSPGTVFVGLSHPGGTIAREFSLAGDRSQVRLAAVETALELLSELPGL